MKRIGSCHRQMNRLRIHLFIYLSNKNREHVHITINMPDSTQIHENTKKNIHFDSFHEFLQQNTTWNQDLQDFEFHPLMGHPF